jgi:hypothetical protein
MKGQALPGWWEQEPLSYAALRDCCTTDSESTESDVQAEIESVRSGKAPS